MKIMTAEESRQIAYIEAQNAMLDHLIPQGFRVPKVVETKHGRGYAMEVVGGASHNVRLFEYVPGTIMAEVQPTEALHYQVGEQLAKMHAAMQVKRKSHTSHLR
jgi:Ser/Thr protein kinase RdoA (MazF antagonist)